MSVTRLACLFVLGCTTAHPTPTGTTCDDTGQALTWENFGRDFMTRYCTNCHSHCLTTLGARNNASLYHDFDSLQGVYMIAHGKTDHIDEQAGWGPKAQNNFMPGAGTDGRCPSTLGGPLDEACPEPTSAERTQLAHWLACEIDRPHDFSTDAGIPSCP